MQVFDTWLVGWLGFTALQHFIGYVAPVSVVNVRMSVRTGFVGSYYERVATLPFHYKPFAFTKYVK